MHIIEVPLIDLPPVTYPESDGQPMGETDWHVYLTSGLLQIFLARYRDREDVHAGANLFMYFKEGDPTAVVAPDVYVAFGVKPGKRRVWKTWEEGRFPQVVFEVCSKDSRLRDVGPKRGLYEVLGVTDYFVYDPTGEALEPPVLRGWSRRGDVLVPIEPHISDGRVLLRSPGLGVDVYDEGDRIRLVDVESGEPVLYHDEEAAARKTAETGRLTAEAEVERLRAEIERLSARSS